MSDVNPGALTLGQARAAASAVHRANLGSRALRTVRPYGIGPGRGRGPLWLRLYLASRDGRLVYRGVDSFALLEPPTARRADLGRGAVHRLLRTVDQHWDLFTFGIPPLLALLAALAVGLARGSLVVALALVLVAVTYVLVFQVAGVLRGVIWLARLGRRTGGPGRSMAESVPAYQWSVPLLHHVDADRTDELTRALTDRLVRIVEGRLRDQARSEGASIGPVVLHHVLVLLSGGITTAAAHAWLVRNADDDQLPYGPAGEVLLVMSGGRLEEADAEPITGGGGVLLLYLTAVALAIAVCAVFVASDEASRCADAVCLGRPVTWTSAVHYLAQRLLLSDPADLSPAGPPGVVIGWLVSLLGVMTLPVFYVAGRQEVRRFLAERNEWRGKLARLTERARVLLLVVTEVERNAVLAVVSAHTRRRARIRFHAQGTVYDLGQVENAEVLLVQAGEAGVVEEAAMGHTARTAIETLRPDYVILLGICYGLRPAADVDDGPGGGAAGDQHLGDVLVSRRLQGLDHMAVREANGGIQIVRRGAHVPASQIMIDRCQVGQATWPQPSTRVHIGQMLSANTLVDSERVVRALRREFPDAIGGEMEGIGVYTAASLQKVDWIMIKGICDWGTNKTSVHQEIAARNSASFVTHVLGIGALNQHRWGRRGGPA